MEFEEFKIKYKEYFTNNKIPSEEFLSWLIGFVEGDGSFIIDGRNNLQLVISQGMYNINILNIIKEELGFGRVIKQGKRTYRYIVEQKKLLELIILIFNGNMILPTRIKRFKLFLEVFNKKAIKGKIILKPIEFKQFNKLPSLDNLWLSGLIDCEGYFHVSLSKLNNNFRFSFLLSQKGIDNLPIFSKIKLLLKSGFIREHYNKGNYELIITSLKSIYNSNLFYYLDKYNLKTTKYYSYLLWKKIGNDIKNKKHLDLSYGRLKLIEETKLVNYIKKQL